MAESFTIPLEFDLTVDGEECFREIAPGVMESTGQKRWVWDMRSPVLRTGEPAKWRHGPPQCEVRLSTEIIEDQVERGGPDALVALLHRECKEAAVCDVVHFLDLGFASMAATKPPAEEVQPQG